MAWTAVALPLTRRALPKRGVVDLWLTEIDELPLAAGPTGLTRRERILKRRIQQQFILRLLLGSYLKRPGKDVHIVRRELGKPELDAPLHATGLRFNLSHSGGWLAIAVTRDLEVGVDIEQDRVLKRASDLARRYFPDAEADWIGAMDAADRSRAFLSHWTAREALVKAAGTGIAGALADIALSHSPRRIQKLPADWPEPSVWSLLQPEAPGGLIASLAAPHPDLRIQCYCLQAAP